MKITLHPQSLSDIYKNNMILLHNELDVKDIHIRKIIQKMKGKREFEDSDNKHIHDMINLQKSLIDTIINIQKVIDSSSE